MTVVYVASCKLPTKHAEFIMHIFEDPDTGKEHIALVLGEVCGKDDILCRVHSECLTGDSLFSMRCDCGSQLDLAMSRIAAAGAGVILYLRQEGRGIGLLNKIRAYELQDKGADTVEANERLGFDADLRDYTMCKNMFHYLEISKISLMTNNPIKIKAMEKIGIEVSQRIPIETGHNDHNARYLATKEGKLGHLFGKKANID
ncbi:MAG: GTP cyclohydrolase II [Candidatus Azotimanducaceae bacterium]|uniref:GTP cyclohydrolase-2 n=1 Tax=OM182 bacterium TaxID=2510334 RepID=A0A520S2R2_9GAMM|nr:MAG: GTP cyclohydrolase II [OM182 bacterium]